MRLMRNSAIALSMAVFAFCASDAMAEDAGSSVDVTVQNAFTFTEDVALNFGTFVAISDATNTATLAIDATGATTVTNNAPALIIELVSGVQGQFTISGAAPTTGLNVTLPTSVTLTCGACSGSQPDFVVNTFVDDSVAGVVTTDGSGGATLDVGATLNTQADANPYEDGVYSGAYTVSVNY